MISDPTHDSPDLIDERDPTDPSHFDPRPGEPAVLPGITLPTDLPPGWTIDANGAVVPPPASSPGLPRPVVTLPKITVTPPPAPARSSASSGAAVLAVLGGLLAFGWALTRLRGFA